MLRDYIPALKFGHKIHNSDLLGGGFATTGNVYHVIKSTESFYDAFKQDYNVNYRDGSESVKTTIAAGLAVTVECRNDYVLVGSSDGDYDITAALALDKKSVHLIAPSGLGNDRGATNGVRIDQTTAATTVFAVSDTNVEIAGFYVKPYIGVSHMTMAATSYAPNIHNNTFVLKWTTSNEASIVGASASDAGAWGSIERNWFVSQAGDDQTCAKIIDLAAQATGARVCYNDFMLGDGNTATVGVSNLAVKGSVNYNTFASAGTDATWTHCIAIGTYGTAIGNRGTVADSIIVTGGSAGVSLSDNMNGAGGGAVDEA